ncbi:MAG: ankyrin repeat domain-containing protein [Gallionella sp.]
MDEKLLRILDNRERNYPHALATHFPRVLGHILSLWETPDVEDYFYELMVTTRHSRQGFPTDVAADIIYLSMVHARGKRSNFADGSWDQGTNKNRRAIEGRGISFSVDGFFKSIELGMHDVVGLFLSCGADIHTLDERDWTPLTVAAFGGHRRVAKLLLKGGANVHVVDKAGYTALHWAAFNGYSKLVKLLLNYDADVNARSNHGWSPLIQAATRGHLSVVSILIERGADVSNASKDGWTSLHKAVSNGHDAVVKLLFSKGADVNAVTQDAVSALDLARRLNNQQIISLLSGTDWQRVVFDFTESRPAVQAMNSRT